MRLSVRYKTAEEDEESSNTEEEKDTTSEKEDIKMDATHKSIEKTVQDLLLDEAEHVEKLKSILKDVGGEDVSKEAFLSVRDKTAEHGFLDKETEEFFFMADELDRRGYEEAADSVTRVAFLGDIMKGLGSLIGKGLGGAGRFLSWTFDNDPATKNAYRYMEQYTQELLKSIKSKNLAAMDTSIVQVYKYYQQLSIGLRESQKQYAESIKDLEGNKEQQQGQPATPDQAAQGYAPVPGGPGSANVSAPSSSPNAPRAASKEFPNLRLAYDVLKVEASNRLDEQGFTNLADHLDEMASFYNQKKKLTIRSAKLIRTEIIPGPAFLASAFVNADMSGLEKEDEEMMDSFEEYIDGGIVVGAEGEQYFRHNNSPWSNLGMDVIDYVVHYHDREGE